MVGKYGYTMDVKRRRVQGSDGERRKGLQQSRSRSRKQALRLSRRRPRATPLITLTSEQVTAGLRSERRRCRRG
jgi:hypothetical protein